MQRPINSPVGESHEQDSVIKKTEWFGYISPQIVINIKRRVLSVVGDQFDISEMDATTEIGMLCIPHARRIADFDPGQSEIILVPPMSGVWNVLHHRGQFYVSDDLFFPWE